MEPSQGALDRKLFKPLMESFTAMTRRLVKSFIDLYRAITDLLQVAF